MNRADRDLVERVAAELNLDPLEVEAMLRAARNCRALGVPCTTCGNAVLRRGKTLCIRCWRARRR